MNHTFINFQNASISGVKFNDLNGNGLKMVGASDFLGPYNFKIPVVEVLNTTTTVGINGSYSFTNLGPGTYRVRSSSR
jgi:hypothetical protein